MSNKMATNQYNGMQGWNPPSNNLSGAGTAAIIAGVAIAAIGIGIFAANSARQTGYTCGFNDAYNMYGNMKGGANVNLNG